MRLTTIASSLFLFFLAACGGEPPNPPESARHLCGPGAGYAVCPEGTSCREGKCWLPCKADADCPSGQYCDPARFCATAHPPR